MKSRKTLAVAARPVEHCVNAKCLAYDMMSFYQAGRGCSIAALRALCETLAMV